MNKIFFEIMLILIKGGAEPFRFYSPFYSDFTSVYGKSMVTPVLYDAILWPNGCVKSPITYLPTRRTEWPKYR